MLQNVSQKDLPNTWQIKHVLECKRCIESCPAGMLLEDYVRVTVGLTPYGLQVWCKRHQVNVAHLDFRGARIRMNATSGTGHVWLNTH